MRRNRIGLATLLAGSCLAIAAQTSHAQDTAPAKPAEAVELSVSPAAEPAPALKYRLMPVYSDLQPGDAAPIYLRLRHELASDRIAALVKNHADWIELPIEKFPKAEARKFIDEWQWKTRQLGFGARRQECNWNYTLPEERFNAFEILLPDAQEMRNWARLLALKARLEIAEGNFDEAVRTIETGLAFGRHVGNGPFLINALVGTAIEMSMLNQAETLIAQPGAPNLYWALAALPSPLVPLRNALEMEQRLGEFMIPELKDPEEILSENEWAVRLHKLYERMQHLTEKLVGFNEGGETLKKRQAVTFAQYREELLKTARPWLEEHGFDKKAVDAMSDDEAAMRSLTGQYRTLRDGSYKATYLPLGDALAHLKRAEDVNKSAADGPLAAFAAIFPSIRATLTAEAKLERRIAALRCIEGIRAHAAAHDGKLPTSLADITVVPVPNNPNTNPPFGYEINGNVATLSAAGIGDPPAPSSELQYRISIRP